MEEGDHGEGQVNRTPDFKSSDSAQCDPFENATAYRRLGAEMPRGDRRDTGDTRCGRVERNKEALGVLRNQTTMVAPREAGQALLVVRLRIRPEKA